MEAIAHKIELRDRMRAALAGTTDAAARAASDAIRQRALKLSEINWAGQVLVYVSNGHEVATHELIRQLLAIGKRVCVPAFDEELYRYQAAAVKSLHADLAPGKFGIPEPKVLHAVPIMDVDALLVPGMAFDGRGNRLGRGMGFFDRILSEARGVKIALAYDFQILREVPAERHDVRMDFIVTETRIVNCQR